MDRLRRLATLRDDADDLASLALAEIERLRAEVARLKGLQSGEQAGPDKD